MVELTLAELEKRVGKQAGVSRWFEVTQQMIDSFADLTEDWQFIHLDEKRAKGAGFPGTIAHGFLTMSFLSAMYYDALPRLRGAVSSVNYGFDRMRFVSPVIAGSRVRGRFALADLDLTVAGQVTLHHDVAIEIEGEDKPALVARWVNREYLDTA